MGRMSVDSGAEESGASPQMQVSGKTRVSGAVLLPDFMRAHEGSPERIFAKLEMVPAEIATADKWIDIDRLAELVEVRPCDSGADSGDPARRNQSFGHFVRGGTGTSNGLTPQAFRFLPPS